MAHPHLKILFCPYYRHVWHCDYPVHQPQPPFRSLSAPDIPVHTELQGSDTQSPSSLAMEGDSGYILIPPLERCKRGFRGTCTLSKLCLSLLQTDGVPSLRVW